MIKKIFFILLALGRSLSAQDSFIQELEEVEGVTRPGRVTKNNLIEKAVAVVPQIAQTIETLAHTQKKLCAYIEESLQETTRTTVQAKNKRKKNQEELTKLTLSLEKLEQQCNLLLKGL
jgi:hypothetical protein